MFTAQWFSTVPCFVIAACPTWRNGFNVSWLVICRFIRGPCFWKSNRDPKWGLWWLSHEQLSKEHNVQLLQEAMRSQSSEQLFADEFLMTKKLVCQMALVTRALELARCHLPLWKPHQSPGTCRNAWLDIEHSIAHQRTLCDPFLNWEHCAMNLF